MARIWPVVGAPFREMGARIAAQRGRDRFRYMPRRSPGIEEREEPLEVCRANVVQRDGLLIRPTVHRGITRVQGEHGCEYGGVLLQEVLVYLEERVLDLRRARAKGDLSVRVPFARGVREHKQSHTRNMAVPHSCSRYRCGWRLG